MDDIDGTTRVEVFGSDKICFWGTIMMALHVLNTSESVLTDGGLTCIHSFRIEEAG
jgi:hypothetical protein